MKRANTNIYKRIHRNGKVSWMIRWKDPITGLWLARTAGKTEEEALAIEGQVRQDLVMEKEIFPENKIQAESTTVSEVVEIFFQSPKFLSGQEFWQTEIKRRIRKDVIPNLGSQKFATLTRDQIVKFYLKLKERGLSHASIQKYHAVMCFLGDVYFDQTNHENVVRSIRKFKRIFPDQPPSRDINFLTPEELDRLFAVARRSRCRMLYPFVQFLAHTGLRRSEAADLQWKDIDEAGGFIHIRKSKSGRARMVPLEQGARDAIQRMDRRCEFVFSKPGGGRYNKRYLLRPLKTAAKAAGLNKRVDLHTMRHSWGSNKIRQGWGLKKVSTILGHADISITSKVYSHLLDGDLKVRDDFAFDIGATSANDRNLKDRDMSVILGEVLSRLAENSNESLKESLRDALSRALPRLQAAVRVTESAAPATLMNDTVSPDSPTTLKTPSFATLMLRTDSNAAAQSSSKTGTQTPETKKAQGNETLSDLSLSE